MLTSELDANWTNEKAQQFRPHLTRDHTWHVTRGGEKVTRKAVEEKKSGVTVQ